MKPTKSILILLSLFLISNCGEEVREVITDRYDNGQKKSLVIYKGEGVDEVVVERITFNENGDILILEEPLDKLKIVREYYENGRTNTETNYKDGEKNGKFLYYYENGQIEGEGNYKDGEKDGKYTLYYENGKIKEKGYYKDGELDGLIKSYFENGELETKRQYINGIKDGECISKHQNGIISEDVTFVNGRGFKKTYYKSGKKKYEGEIIISEYKDIIWETEFGEIREYFEDGSIRHSFNVVDTLHRNYIESVYDGKMLRHYENGQIMLICEHNNGIDVGLYEMWLEDGTKRVHLEYKNGEGWNGYQFSLDENGKFQWKLIYKDGEVNIEH